MVIDLNNINSGLTGRTRSVDSGSKSSGSSSKTSSEASTVASGSDSVQLSSEAQEISRIQASINALPEINQERVNEIKSQIENGTYQIDALSLAEKIIANDNQLV